MPWRTSIKMTATSAVEAPVTMLRMCCSCPWDIGYDEFAFGGGKEAVGYVNGDALLAFRS